jgi:hypothetical protein
MKKPPVNTNKESVSLEKSTAWHRLAECVDNFHLGPWTFIQLRGTPLSPAYIDDDDCDLLCDIQAINSLFRTIYSWVLEGKCHVHIASRRPDKYELCIYSIDGCHRFKCDLWINLWQLDKGRRKLVFADCLQFIVPQGSQIKRLPIELEAALYIQHILTKRKTIHKPSTKQRLKQYIDELKTNDNENLVSHLQEILNSGKASDNDNQFTLKIIDSNIHPKNKSNPIDTLKKIRNKLHEASLAAPRKTKLISIMGCDGVGKTTLANTLSDSTPYITRVFTGKHLYRKSIIHKLAVIFIRPLLLQSREKFDESLAPWVYIRACIGIRIRHWKQPANTVLLIDRSIFDFLYLDRKTDQPKFSRFKFLSRAFGKRIPTIHCIASHDNVSKRKLEITAKGHTMYDRDMFNFFSNISPVNYLAFNNDRSLEDGVNALRQILPQLGIQDN